MRFIADQDYHIHSGLSLCSDDPKQTPQAILDFSKKNGFKKICLTDHYWDESVPKAGSIDFLRHSEYRLHQKGASSAAG